MRNDRFENFNRQRDIADRGIEEQQSARWVRSMASTPS
jgi:hypothetical protein